MRRKVKRRVSDQNFIISEKLSPCHLPYETLNFRRSRWEATRSCKEITLGFRGEQSLEVGGNSEFNEDKDHGLLRKTKITTFDLRKDEYELQSADRRDKDGASSSIFASLLPRSSLHEESF